MLGTVALIDEKITVILNSIDIIYKIEHYTSNIFTVNSSYIPM